MNIDSKLSDKVVNITPQCKVVLYPWINQVDDDILENADLTKCERLEISSQVINVSYNKTIQNAAGTFSITLSNSPNYGSNDWKDIIQRGTWLMIYMDNDNTLTLNPQVGAPDRSNIRWERKKRRCIGRVDRVAVKTSLSPNGAVTVQYVVSGRDFGVVYEDATIWQNVFEFDRIKLDSVATSGLSIIAGKPINEILSLIHDLFMYPMAIEGIQLSEGESLTRVALQFIMPDKLVADLDIAVGGDTPYWGALKDIQKFKPTAAGVSVASPVAFLTGNAWNMLKQHSIPELHELFTELDDSGRPQLVFRPLPFGLSNAAYPTISKYLTMYKDIEEVVTVDGVELVGLDLGEDEHSRYNSFMVTIATQLINNEDNIVFLKNSGFPYHNQDSIKRHGFKPMHVEVNSLIKNGDLTGGEGNRNIAIEYNEVLLDYWQNMIYAESGSINLMGRSDIRIGKVLEFEDNVPYANSRRYYIEGYADNFMVSDTGANSWTQSVNVTHGYEIEDLKDFEGGVNNFNTRNVPFRYEGEYTPRGS